MKYVNTYRLAVRRGKGWFIVCESTDLMKINRLADAYRKTDIVMIERI